MRAISAFSRDAGMSTRVCLAVTALRIRASMSAMGSVISFCSQVSTIGSSGLLPAALGDARDVAFERELAEAQAAQREFAHVGARAAAQAAAVPQADLEFRRLLFFRDLCSGGHIVSSV